MKGVTQVIEATLGAIIILGLLMFLFTTQPVQEQDVHEISYKCLTYAKDFTDFNDKLNSCLPSTYDYQFKICENIDCSVALPENQTITVVDYIDVGPKLIKLWVYR
ncbi:MAG: hypothetical protein KJ906_02840 [Nanoarchaeota archaeon]|nr:hypothetical protein [Nanoarchaeota archaeon]